MSVSPILNRVSKECGDCERVLPLKDFPYTANSGGRRLHLCRICFQLSGRKDAVVFIAPEPELVPRVQSNISCPKCGGYKRPTQAYCAPCMKVYMRKRRAGENPVKPASDGRHCSCGEKLPEGRVQQRCRDCQRVYMRNYYIRVKQERNRKLIAKQHDMRGVDIDAVHRNPRWNPKLLKKAA